MGAVSGTAVSGRTPARPGTAGGALKRNRSGRWQGRGSALGRHSHSAKACRQAVRLGRRSHSSSGGARSGTRGGTEEGGETKPHLAWLGGNADRGTQGKGEPLMATGAGGSSAVGLVRDPAEDFGGSPDGRWETCHWRAIQAEKTGVGWEGKRCQEGLRRVDSTRRPEGRETMEPRRERGRGSAPAWSSMDSSRRQAAASGKRQGPGYQDKHGSSSGNACWQLGG